MPIQPELGLLLVAAGALLAVTGGARLAGAALGRMPLAVALVAVVVGTGVAVLGLTWPRDPSERTQLPLTPQTSPQPRSTPAPSEDGSIEGSVATAAGEPVAGAQVVLQRFEATERVGISETATGPDGSFAFAGLSLGMGIGYTVHTTYEGALFGSDLVILHSRGPHETVTLTVAPPTEDDSVLGVEIDSTVLIGEEEGVQILQVLALRNTGPRAFVGGVRLPLLPGASGLRPTQGLDRTSLTSSDDGELVSLSPVLPGLSEIVYTYSVPLPASGLRIERPLHYPTERFELLVAGTLDRVEAPGLRPEGEARIGPAGGTERTYARYSAEGLAAGTTIGASLRAGAGEGLRNAVVALAVALSLLILLLPLLRRRRRPEEAGRAVSEEATVEAL